MKATAKETGLQGRIINVSSISHRGSDGSCFDLDKLNDKSKLVICICVLQADSVQQIEPTFLLFYKTRKVACIVSCVQEIYKIGILTRQYMLRFKFQKKYFSTIVFQRYSLIIFISYLLVLCNKYLIYPYE